MGCPIFPYWLPEDRKPFVEAVPEEPLDGYVLDCGGPEPGTPEFEQYVAETLEEARRVHAGAPLTPRAPGENPEHRTPHTARERAPVRVLR